MKDVDGAGGTAPGCFGGEGCGVGQVGEGL